MAAGLDIDAIMDAFGNMPGALAVTGLLWVTPVHLLLEKYCSLFANLNDEGFVDTFLRLEKWMYDSPDIPGSTYRQFIKDCYQENLLIRNRMVVGENFCLDTGHLGIFVSGKSRNIFLQKITQWLGERDNIEESMKRITNLSGTIRRFRSKKRSYSRKPAQALF